MMHVRFTHDFDYPATPRSTVAYPAGWTGPVKRACGELAIQKGRAVAVDAPPRDGAPGEPDSPPEANGDA